MEQEIKNLIGLVKQVSDEIQQVETDIEIQELRQKTCSDETQNSLDFLAESMITLSFIACFTGRPRFRFPVLMRAREKIYFCHINFL